MNDKRLKAEGVEKLKSYSGGREYLSALQDKYKVDLAQPGSELYDKHWKAKADRAAIDRQREVVKSHRYKEEFEARKEFDKNRGQVGFTKGRVF